MPLILGAGVGNLISLTSSSTLIDPEWLELQVVTTAANQTYSWQSSAGTSPNHTTEWGDGNITTHTANGIYTNTYASAGTYTLRIKCFWGSNGAFNIRPNSDRTRLTGLLSPIPNFPGLRSLSSFMQACTGVTSLPNDLLRYVVNVTNLDSFMNSCTGVTSLPNDLLRYAVGVTSARYFMAVCTGVTFLPADLLRHNTALTNLLGFMQACTKVSLRTDIFGPNTTSRFINQSVIFTDAFSNVGTTSGTPQGTAPEVWSYNYGTGIPTTTNAFAGNSTSLTNWASIPAAWGGPA